MCCTCPAAHMRPLAPFDTVHRMASAPAPHQCHAAECTGSFKHQLRCRDRLTDSSLLLGRIGNGMIMSCGYHAACRIARQERGKSRHFCPGTGAQDRSSIG